MDPLQIKFYLYLLKVHTSQWMCCLWRSAAETVVTSFEIKSFLEPIQHTRKEIQSPLSWGLTDLHLVTPWSHTKPHDIHSLSPVIPTFCVLVISVRCLFEKPKILPDVLTRSTRFQVLTVVVRGVLPIATRSLVAGKYRCLTSTFFLHLQGGRNLFILPSDVTAYSNLSHLPTLKLKAPPTLETLIFLCVCLATHSHTSEESYSYFYGLDSFWIIVV